MGGVEREDEVQENVSPVDPWAAAFEALAKTDAESPEGAEGGSGQPASEHGGEDSAEALLGDGTESEDQPRGPGDADVLDADIDGGGEGEGSPFDVDLDSYRADWEEEIKDKAVQVMAKEFIKRGIRNKNGKIGATIYDEDIYRREEDGTARFYNPETGREFTGDNPRRQAQEWVDDYNREVAQAFNNACGKYAQKLMEEQAAPMAVLEFAPKYQALDPIRKSMFDSVIEDYEIMDDSGNVVGYSTDLNKALAMVERQVAAIQGYAKANPKAPTSPAVDMKASPTGKTAKPEFKSLAEAMEWQQNQELEKIRKRK